MRLFGLVGYPLAQSFSKKYFDEKFAKEDLTDCRFTNFPLTTIEEFPGLIERHPDLQGLAVTIPYKQEVLTYLHDTKHLPPGMQACNCIRIREGNLIGYNTDHIGFEKSFTRLLQPQHTHALVLGNGGAADAVMYVLRNKGIPAQLVSRTIHSNSTLTYAELDASVMATHTIIINTTPLGMFPREDECPPIPYEYITAQHLLYDVVYNPSQTLFLQKGAARGAMTCNGADMLYLQAEENWKIWNS